MAIVTNFHKFSGLKQSKFILLFFWRSEIQNQFPQIKIKMAAGLLPSK
jgi:hypothetical protein